MSDLEKQDVEVGNVEADQPEVEDAEKESANLKANIVTIHCLAKKDGQFPAPIDIDIIHAKCLRLPPLYWKNFQRLPTKMMLSNSGHTLILSAMWDGERPYIRGGPLRGAYVFSQLHFHWGKTALEGSEHTIDGARFPLEMHAVFFKTDYPNQIEALKDAAGVITLVYFFEIKFEHNPVMDHIVSMVGKIKDANTAVSIKPFCLHELVRPFGEDYLVYWGSVRTAAADSILLWLISRHGVSSISGAQLDLFQRLQDPKMRPIRRNFRDIEIRAGRQLFHVNPITKYTNSTLSPVPNYGPSIVNVESVNQSSIDMILHRESNTDN